MSFKGIFEINFNLLVLPSLFYGDLGNFFNFLKISKK